MSTATQQRTAISLARQMAIGAIKPPKRNSSEARLLSSHLADAERTLVLFEQHRSQFLAIVKGASNG